MEPYDEDYEDSSGTNRSVETTVKIAVEWNESAVMGQVTDKVTSLVYDSIREQVGQAVLNCLDAKVNEAIQEVMEREIRPKDRWGDSAGEPVTIRALLQRDVETWLTERVNSRGETSSSRYNDTKLRIHWLFREALDKDLHTQVKKAIKENIGSVEAMIDDEVKAKIAQLIKQR